MIFNDIFAKFSIFNSGEHLNWWEGGQIYNSKQRPPKGCFTKVWLLIGHEDEILEENIFLLNFV